MSPPATGEFTHPTMRALAERWLAQARSEGVPPLEYALMASGGDPELDAWSPKVFGSPFPVEVEYLTALGVEIPETRYECFLLAEWAESGAFWGLWRPWDPRWREERRWERPDRDKDRDRCWWSKCGPRGD